VYRTQLSSTYTKLLKALEGMTHSFKASRATPGRCTHVHPPEDTNTALERNTPSKNGKDSEGETNSSTGSRATVSYCKLGYPS